MDDPDAIWKPGYDGPAPIVPSYPEPAESTETAEHDEPERPTRRRLRWVAVVAVVGLAIGGVLVARDRLQSDPSDGPDASVFGGPEARRLPETAAELWSVDVGDAGEHWVDVVGRELVIAAIAEPTPTLVALDARTGAQRWTAPLTGVPGDVTPVGMVDGVLVLEEQVATGSTVTGVDMATGDTRWSTEPVPNAGHVGLVGTPFVARLPAPPDRSVTLIDASSGRDVGAITDDPDAPGRPGGWFTDRRGTWYVISGGEVAAYDLRSELGDPTVVGRVGPPEVLPEVLPVVVGDRLAVVDGAGAVAFVGPGATVSANVPANVPTPVGSLTPVSDSGLVVTAPGSITGLAVAGDSVDVAWSRSEGALADHHPVEGGTLLQVATRGGGETELVDGRTGETVEQLTMTAGALQALEVAGDGYVALHSAPLGARLAGVDLDGTERWSILGSEPVVVGDRVVVRATSTDGQLRVTAYGDAE